jgi:hypothetical protein
MYKKANQMMALFCLFLGLISASVTYPIHIGQPGYFVVNEPIIAKRPANALVLSDQTSSNPLTPKLFSTQTISHPPLSEFDLSQIISGNARVTHTGEYFAMFWKNQCDRFNRCILEGLDDRRAIIFGSVFLQLFKAAYPGLRNVHINKEEIVELVLMANKKFSVDPSNERHKDFFLKCLKFYYDYYPSPEHAKSFQFIRVGPLYFMRLDSALIMNAAKEYKVTMRHFAISMAATFIIAFMILLGIISNAY